jgi:BirA family transcriptional regulator, biotin operon repressor / biotin---[acetyl-CoA-carboxylase] ligase
MTIGHRVIRLSTTTSTMDEIGRLAEAGEPQGVVVCADYQTGGQGRAGRRWLAPPGSALLCSILLRPTMPPSTLGSLPLCLGVAVADAIEQFCDVPCQLKWPNDVLIKEKKVAGVLSTSRISGETVDHLAVGIGINVSANPEQLPPMATSLAIETGRTLDKDELLTVLLTNLDRQYRALINAHGRFDSQEWTKRAAFLGGEVFVRDNDVFVSGRFVGVDDTGALILELGDGTTKTFVAGDLVRGPRPIEDNSAKMAF